MKALSFRIGTQLVNYLNHGVAADLAEAAALALHAGVDMDMTTGAYLNTLASNLQTGEVSLAEIDRAVLRVLRIKALAGLFDHPFTDPLRAGQEMVSAKNRELARQVGRESLVLLKNKNDLLPLENHFHRVFDYRAVGPCRRRIVRFLGSGRSRRRSNSCFDSPAAGRSSWSPGPLHNIGGRIH